MASKLISYCRQSGWMSPPGPGSIFILACGHGPCTIFYQNFGPRTRHENSTVWNYSPWACCKYHVVFGWYFHGYLYGHTLLWWFEYDLIHLYRIFYINGIVLNDLSHDWFLPVPVFNAMVQVRYKCLVVCISGDFSWTSLKHIYITFFVLFIPIVIFSYNGPGRYLFIYCR